MYHENHNNDGKFGKYRYLYSMEPESRYDPSPPDLIARMEIGSERPGSDAAAQLILGSSSWLLLGAAASSADLPAVAKVPPATAQSWAGFYLGVHGGYGWGDNNFRQYLVETDPQPFLEGFRSKGAVVGAQAGYNWQFGRAVTGFEIDWSAADISGSAQPLSAITVFGLQTHDRTDRLKYLGTARGRVGWLPTDRVLVYGTAGFAWGRVDENERRTTPAFNITTNVTTPFDRLGWVAGAGIEAMPFGPNWIGRVEYLHYDFGAVHESYVVTSSSPTIWRADRAGRQSFDVLRAGLSYKFGAPGGINAAYAKMPSVATAAPWAGFYLGVHGGYGWGKNNFTTTVSTTPPVDLAGPKLRGGLYGGHAGHNWQFDRAVASVELDLSIASINGSAQVQYTAAPTTFTESRTPEVEALGSVRGRLGWLPLDSVLLYGTGGLSWERIGTTSGFSSSAPAGSLTSSTYNSENRFGWVAGAGAEVLLPGGNWIGRLEYLHYDFGTIARSGAITNAAGTTTFQPGHHSVDVLRAGVSYKFGEPGTTVPVSYAKAPQLAPSLASSWAGLYLGGHAGYGWHDDDFTRMIDFTSGTYIGGIKSSGWVAGGHVGYNWQYGRIVAGLEADFSFADIEGASRPVTQPGGFGGSQTDTFGDRIKYLATARARLGWLPVNNVMLYAAAGPAFARMERTWTTTFDTPGFFRNDVLTTPTDRFGAVVGAGAEWMPFGPNWIGRVEYLHFDFGTVRETTTTVTSLPGTISVSEHRGRQTVDIVRAGVSYKFQ
jgi:opacity protein-like surface antigen